jgi:hypothetical protein
VHTEIEHCNAQNRSFEPEGRPLSPGKHASAYPPATPSLVTRLSTDNHLIVRNHCIQKNVLS